MLLLKDFLCLQLLYSFCLGAENSNQLQRSHTVKYLESLLAFLELVSGLYFIQTSFSGTFPLFGINFKFIASLSTLDFKLQITHPKLA